MSFEEKNNPSDSEEIRCDVCSHGIEGDMKIFFLDQENQLLHAFCFDCFNKQIPVDLEDSAPKGETVH